MEIHKGKQVAPKAVHGGSVNLLDATPSLFRLQADQLQHADLGDGIAVAGASDGQCRYDGQSQRNFHLDRGALSQSALNCHRAADLFDVGPHDVHSDAPPGELGDFVRGRKTGQEDQVYQFAVVQPVGLFRGYQLGFDCLGADTLRVDSPAVISDLDNDLAALVEGIEGEPAFRRLAAGSPLLGRLDAMIDGIAHQMRKRVADGLNDALVQLGFLALHFEACLLAACDRQVANHARKLAPDCVDRLHARLHDACLQFRG